MLLSPRHGDVPDGRLVRRRGSLWGLRHCTGLRGNVHGQQMAQTAGKTSLAVRFGVCAKFLNRP